MECRTRYDEYKDEYFDTVLLKIKRGDIKCGKYAHRVKISNKKDYDGKELFKNGKSDNSEEQ